MDITRRDLFGLVAGAVAGTAAKRSIEFEALTPDVPEGYLSVEAEMRPYEKDGMLCHKVTGIKNVVLYIDGKAVARSVLKHMPRELDMVGARRL